MIHLWEIFDCVILFADFNRSVYQFDVKTLLLWFVMVLNVIDMVCYFVRIFFSKFFSFFCTVFKLF